MDTKLPDFIRRKRLACDMPSHLERLKFLSSRIPYLHELGLSDYHCDQEEQAIYVAYGDSYVCIGDKDRDRFDEIVTHFAETLNAKPDTCVITIAQADGTQSVIFRATVTQAQWSDCGEDIEIRAKRSIV